MLAERLAGDLDVATFSIPYRRGYCMTTMMDCAGRQASIVERGVYYSHDRFVAWLDKIILERFGREKSERAICREAGLPETTLYRITKRRQAVSDDVAAKLSAYLGVSLEEFRRRAGLDPIVTNGGVVASKMTQQEIDEYVQMLTGFLRSLRKNQNSRGPVADTPAGDVEQPKS